MGCRSSKQSDYKIFDQETLDESDYEVIKDFEDLATKNVWMQIYKHGIDKYFAYHTSGNGNYSFNVYTKSLVLIKHPPRPEEECCICLSPLKKDVVKLNTCNHYFHAECIASALKEKEECPLCRACPNVPEKLLKRIEYDNISNSSSEISYDDYDDY